MFTQKIQYNFLLKYSIVRLSFVNLRWAQLYASLVPRNSSLNLKWMKALNGHHATVQLAEKLASITKWEFISKRFFPVLRKETAHRFDFRKLGFFSELISTWAAEWTVSRGLSILTDLQKQTQGSTPSAIRRPPLPTTYLPKTPLLRNNARARDVHLTKAAPATSGSVNGWQATV